MDVIRYGARWKRGGCHWCCCADVWRELRKVLPSWLRLTQRAGYVHGQ